MQINNTIPKERIVVNQLVDDSFLKEMQEKQITCSYTHLKDGRFKVEIKRLMVQYAKKILKTPTNRELMIAISDLFFIFNQLLDLYGVSMAQIMEISTQKAATNGKFDDKLFLYFIDYNINDDRTILKKYENNRHIKVQTISDEIKRIHFNKLIRDKIPTFLKAEQCKIKTLTPGQWNMALKRKLLEESYEVFYCSSYNDIKAEIADFYDIFFLLLSYYNISISHIEPMKTYDSFTNRIFVQEILVPTDSPFLSTYQQKFMSKK